MRLILAAAALVLALSWSSSAQAWGPLGHRLVARLAQAQLAPPARAEVERLLATEGLQSLADIATWADDLRGSDPGLGRRSARWHYINLGELACRYDRDAACRGGNCVVEAINAQAAILGDRNRSDAERLQALKFVVHFVGDVHQPMHAGYARDHGGNTVQLQLHGRGTNLHAVWDTPLLRSAGLREDAYATRLQRGQARPPADAARYTRAAPARWAERSCAIATADGVYPATASIDDDYLNRHRPTAERQVKLAGARLAALLDSTLAEAPPAPAPPQAR